MIETKSQVQLIESELQFEFTNLKILYENRQLSIH